MINPEASGILYAVDPDGAIELSETDFVVWRDSDNLAIDPYKLTNPQFWFEILLDTAGTIGYSTDHFVSATTLLEYRPKIVNFDDIQESLMDLFHGVSDGIVLNLVVTNIDDGVHDTWETITAAEEIRNKYVSIYRYDEEDKKTFVIRGKILSYTFGTGIFTLEISCGLEDLLTTILPKDVVTTDVFTDTAIGIGSPIPILLGKCINVPLANIQNYTPPASTATNTVASKLEDSAATFTSADVGRYVHNLIDDTWALITALDSPTVLSLDSDIMESGDSYEIQVSDYLLGYGTIEGIWDDSGNNRGVKREGKLVDSGEYTVYDGSQVTPYPGYAFIRFKREQRSHTGDLHSLTADVLGLTFGGASCERNPVTQIKNLLSDSTFGLSQTVDSTSFTSAAGVIDTITDIYSDGAIYQQAQVRDYIDNLLLVARAYIFHNFDREWEISVDFYSGINLELIDGVNFDAQELRVPSANEVIRNIIARYSPVESTDSYQYELTLAVHTFGQDRILDRDLRFVGETVTAKKVMSYIYNTQLKASGADRRILKGAINFEGRNLKRGDIVSATSSLFGLSTVQFRIQSITKNFDGWFDVELLEYDSDLYGDEVISSPTPLSTDNTTHSLQTISSGYVGGMWVTSNSIRTIDGLVGLSSAVTGGVDWRIWAGDATPGNAPFRVDEDGNAYVESLTVVGSAESSSFVSGPLGTGWQINADGSAEFQQITARGIFRSCTFEAASISAINGMMIISNADVLSADMTALDASTITIEGNATFVVGEVLRIKEGTDDEWLVVTDASGAPTYVVTRDLAENYGADSNPIWTAGTSVVSMGVGAVGSETGFIALDAASANSPFIDIYGRNSTTYSDYSLKVRLGWLQGIVDADVGLNSTDVWGLYSDSVYLKGTLVADTGYIGGTTGWVIAAGKITSSGIGIATAAGDATYAFWAGNDTPANAEFSVTHAGALKSVSGQIGGFTIGATTLVGTNLTLDAGNQKILLGSGNDICSLDSADGTYRLAIGHATYGSAPFRVTKAGAVYASAFYGSGGTIGGWNFDGDYLWTGTKQTSNTYSSSGITLSDTGGIRAPKFYISTSGVLNCYDAVFSGTVPSSTDITAEAGADIIMSGGTAGNPSILHIRDGSASSGEAEIRFEMSSAPTTTYYAVMK